MTQTPTEPKIGDKLSETGAYPKGWYRSTEPLNNHSPGRLSRVFNLSASNKISIWLGLFGIAGGLLLSSPTAIVLGALGAAFGVAAAVRRTCEDLRRTKSPTPIGDKMPDGTSYAGVLSEAVTQKVLPDGSWYMGMDPVTHNPLYAAPPSKDRLTYSLRDEAKGATQQSKPPNL